jgi:hypothetical protein
MTSSGSGRRRRIAVAWSEVGGGAADVRGALLGAKHVRPSDLPTPIRGDVRAGPAADSP